MIVLGQGFHIPEGPVWLPDGSLVFVEVGRGRIWRIPEGGEPHVLAEPGGGPNGAAIGPDGTLYVCNNGGGYACELVNGALAVRTDASSIVADRSSGSISARAR